VGQKCSDTGMRPHTLNEKDLKINMIKYASIFSDQNLP